MIPVVVMLELDVSDEFASVPSVEKFDRDPRSGKLLWFSGPPMINPALPPSLTAPRHSLKYLAFLASGGRDGLQSSDGVGAALGHSDAVHSADPLLEKFSIRTDGSVVFSQ